MAATVKITNMGFAAFHAAINYGNLDFDKAASALLGASVLSGASLELGRVAGSSLLLLQHKPPVVVSKEGGIRLNLNEVERGTFYFVEYAGKKYATRITTDEALETYEVIEAS